MVLGFVLYYFLPDRVTVGELKYIEGSLQKKPEYHEGGESSPYASISLIENPKNFDITGCGYKTVNKKLLYALESGDKVRLFVDKNELLKKRLLMRESIPIYGIELSDGNRILSVSKINMCENNKWKKMLWLVFGSFVFFIIEIIRIVRKIR